MGDPAVQRKCQRIQIHRLGDEVVRARAHRSDRSFHAAKGGDHDHRNVRTIFDHALAQVEPGQAAHVHVRDHHVEVLRADSSSACSPLASGDDLVLLLAQRSREHAAHAHVVVDDQTAPLHATSSSASCSVPTGRNTEKVVPFPRRCAP